MSALIDIHKLALNKINLLRTLTKNEYSIVKQDWKCPHARQVILSIAIQAAVALDFGPDSFEQSIMYEIYKKAIEIIETVKDETQQPLDSLPFATKTNLL